MSADARGQDPPYMAYCLRMWHCLQQSEAVKGGSEVVKWVSHRRTGAAADLAATTARFRG